VRHAKSSLVGFVLPAVLGCFVFVLLTIGYVTLEIRSVAVHPALPLQDARVLQTLGMGLVVVIVAFFLLVAALASYLYMEAIRPLDRVVEAVRRIGSGDFSQRVESAGPWEALEISREVNRMAESLAARERQLIDAERLAAVGTLAAGVAHEVNNPLQYMLLRTRAASRSVADLASAPASGAEARQRLAEVAEDHEAIVGGIQQIRRITKGLRLVSRAPNGERTAEDVNPIVESVVAIAASKLGPNVEVATDLRARRRAWVNAGEIGQVVLNLIINAADAVRDEPKGALRLRTRDDGDGIAIEVEDSGPGIPPEIEGRIFLPFFTTKPQGTGLGLPTARKIVEAHGGTIGFRSGPGGTRFTVSLPAAAGRGPEEDRTPAGSPTQMGGIPHGPYQSS
jgi:signal transduction histidine kinase